MTQQGIVTLNLCRTSRKESERLAYKAFKGKRCDWNSLHMAPRGHVRLCTKTQQVVDHGHPVDSMHGIAAPLSITIVP